MTLSLFSTHSGLQMAQLFAARVRRRQLPIAADKWRLRKFWVTSRIASDFRLPRATHRAADATPLSGFEQDDYVRAGAFGERSWPISPRIRARSQLDLGAFHSLGKEAWLRRGPPTE